MNPSQSGRIIVVQGDITHIETAGGRIPWPHQPVSGCQARSWCCGATWMKSGDPRQALLGQQRRATRERPA